MLTRQTLACSYAFRVFLVDTPSLRTTR
jgi:hypothetical protein